MRNLQLKCHHGDDDCVSRVSIDRIIIEQQEHFTKLVMKCTCEKYKHENRYLLQEIIRDYS